MKINIQKEIGTEIIHCKEHETDRLQSLKVDTKIGSLGIYHNFR